MFCDCGENRPIGSSPDKQHVPSTLTKTVCSSDITNHLRRNDAHTPFLQTKRAHVPGKRLRDDFMDHSLLLFVLRFDGLLLIKLGYK